MKFRKMRVEIEATQYDGTQGGDEGVCDDRDLGHPLQPHIHTLEGNMLIRMGDWIITGILGERYPCKADIFALTYEPVEAGRGAPEGVAGG